jgi:hypothetical protein
MALVTTLAFLSGATPFHSAGTALPHSTATSTTLIQMTTSPDATAITAPTAPSGTALPQRTAPPGATANGATANGDTHPAADAIADRHAD